MQGNFDWGMVEAILPPEQQNLDNLGLHPNPYTGQRCQYPQHAAESQPQQTVTTAQSQKVTHPNPQ